MKDEAKRATWVIHLFVECPHCKEDVDLMDDPDFLSDNPALKVGEHGTDLSSNLDVTCPECGEEFLVTTEY